MHVITTCTFLGNKYVWAYICVLASRRTQLNSGSIDTHIQKQKKSKRYIPNNKNFPPVLMNG